MSHRIRMLTSAVITAPEDVAGIRMLVAFEYDPVDPLAVMLTFLADQECKTWIIGRELLRDGLAVKSGFGDVTAWVNEDSPHRYFLALQSGSWTTVFAFNIRAVEGFLAQTYHSIPDGAEFLRSDLDTELNCILGDAA